MEYTIKEKTKAKVVFETTNNKEEIEKAKREAYRKLIQKVTVPGFRKGKAPYEMGAPFVGEARILEEAVNSLLDKNLKEFLEKESITPIVQPDVKIEKMDNDKLVSTYTVEFLPEVDVDLSEKIEVPHTEPDTEKAVQNKLKELQDSFTEISPVERAIKEGDIVSIEWYIENDKKQVRNNVLEVGKDKFVGDFDEKIIGKKKEDSFTIEFKGKKIVIKIVNVKEKKVLPIDDSLAKEAGYENLEALKEKIKKEVENSHRAEEEKEKGMLALETLAKKLDVELPEKLVEEEVEERIKEIKDQYLRKGQKLEDVLKENKETMDEFKEKIKESVVQSIKEELIIRAIIKKNNLTATEEEIKKEFDETLQNNGLTNKNIKLNDRFRALIKDEILRKKVVSILKENAIIKEEGGK